MKNMNILKILILKFVGYLNIDVQVFLVTYSTTITSLIIWKQDRFEFER